MFVASVNPYVVGLITCIATMSLNLKLQKQILMEHQLRKKSTRTKGHCEGLQIEQNHLLVLFDTLDLILIII